MDTPTAVSALFSIMTAIVLFFAAPALAASSIVLSVAAVVLGAVWSIGTLLMLWDAYSTKS